MGTVESSAEKRLAELGMIFDYVYHIYGYTDKSEDDRDNICKLVSNSIHVWGMKHKTSEVLMMMGGEVAKGITTYGVDRSYEGIILIHCERDWFFIMLEDAENREHLVNIIHRSINGNN